MIKSLTQSSDDYKRVKDAIYCIDKTFQDQPTLEKIAKSVHLSKFHFQRLFKRWAGITPMQFLQYTTVSFAKSELKKSKSILEVSLDAGLSSSSRLHDLFVNIHALTPGEFKTLGKNLVVTYGFAKSLFGEALIAFTSRGICHFSFIDENFAEALELFKRSWTGASLIQNDRKCQEISNNIFINKQSIFDLHVKGTNFQINVWKALINIPKNNLITYQEVANFIDKPNAVRAVASAIGKNSIGYLIPCHRVIASSGAFSGYRWGMERKKIIIAHEASEKKVEL